jgi:hypothetical protein
MAISLKGTVKTQAGTPIEGASVRLIGSEEPLGDVGSAALDRPDAVSWTETITDFSGNRWNCWQRFVMNRVAGITWDEFKDQVVEHNPTLRDDGYMFKAEKSYKLPEQATEQPVVAWTRPITDFSGNRWDCWKAFVQGKVDGLTWDEFKDQVAEHNPALRDDDYVFKADKTYVLPENVLRPPEITWTRPLTGFSGNRWQCWEAHVRDQVQGITWAEFMQAVVERNPTLPDDGYVFQADKTYMLPENPIRALYYLFASTDQAGRYAIEGLTTPGDYELFVQALGYHPYRERLSLQVDTVHDVTLTAVWPRMVSQWEGYPTAPAKVRKLIDQALNMLGDDPVVFDSLAPELQKLAFGSNFLNDPSHFHYKDIVCSDLVTICLAAAGVDHDWQVTEPPGTPFNTSHAANYYRPTPNHPKLREVADGEDWLPGDILIYWDGDLALERVRHVNLYIGPFSGTDLSGNPHPQPEGYDVVNASKDFEEGGIEVGTAIRPFTLEFCRTQRFDYQRFRRVRVLELEQEHLGPGIQGFIQVAGDEFMLDGQPFRFVGVNIRGLVHYGGADILPHSQPEHRDVQLKAAQDMGARVVRVFLANRHRTTEEIADRFEEALAKAEEHDLYLIVALTDFYNDSNFNPPDDEIFYASDPWGNTTLNKDFFDGDYRDNYLPFVEGIVRRFRHHKRIFAWELGNELKAWDREADENLRPDLFIQFAATVSRRIRQLDPIHLITTGSISSRACGCNPEQAERLYRLDSLDFLTTHNYHGEDLEDDSSLAQKVGKPFIIEEAGFESGDRAELINDDLEKWVGRKARGYLQWGFMATDHDMGDGDDRFGMDHPFHGADWQDLFSLYKDWAARLV